MTVLIADYQYFGDKDAFSLEEEVFSKAGIDIKYGTCITQDDLIEQSEGASAVLLCNNPEVGEKFFLARPECKVVLRYGIGYNSINLAQATAHGSQDT